MFITELMLEQHLNYLQSKLAKCSNFVFSMRVMSYDMIYSCSLDI